MSLYNRSHHCGRFAPAPISRREMLSQCALGFGSVALAAMLNDNKAQAETGSQANPGVLSQLHHPAKAKSVIFLYMDGGPSQIDTFDYKPLLEKYHGKNPKQVLGKVEPTQFDNNGNMLASPWKFKQYGQAAHWVSELFPHVAEMADELAVVKSMTSNFSEHTSANYFLHTGNGLQGRPSMGAWVTYGLGSECENLPGFVVINGGLIPPGGLDNFNSGFLPATYQGSVFKPQAPGVANAQPLEKLPRLQGGKLSLLRSLDKGLLNEIGRNDAVESAIANYELAARMQAAVPDLMDLKGESDATRKLYGFDSDYPQTKIFAAECLLARRMVERGVRFIELTCPSGNGDRWDQHSGLKDGHTKNCQTVDQPIAGLLRDLKSRGLLESTLVVWVGEFGRTPFAQGTDGRDHNPYGFTIWLAGGGVKAGTSYGATDDFGYKAVEGRQRIYDLHATMLHLLGVDHKKLTYRFSGRDMRLTDVHGELIKSIIA